MGNSSITSMRAEGAILRWPVADEHLGGLVRGLRLVVDAQARRGLWPSKAISGR